MRVMRRILGIAGVLLTMACVAAVVARLAPSDVSAMPYLPIAMSVMPWFVVVSALATVLTLAGRRWLSALVALLCLVVQVWWQLPFYRDGDSLPADATRAIATAHPNPIDGYARVMTLNVYKGAADPEAIVDTVSRERVEVLALQETTDDFVGRLESAGIGRYLPYSTVSSSDGVYGNGLWSVTSLQDPVEDEVGSSASFMPGATVAFDDGATPVRFVSVHTTSPVPGYWRQWKRSLDELGMMRSHDGYRYVFMGDFNATYDHAPFRDFLGSRFRDAARLSARGLTFTWPANRSGVPRFAAIDHIVVDQGMRAGRVSAVPIAGSDHAALLATIAVS